MEGERELAVVVDCANERVCDPAVAVGGLDQLVGGVDHHASRVEQYRT